MQLESGMAYDRFSSGEKVGNGQHVKKAHGLPAKSAMRNNIYTNSHV